MLKPTVAATPRGRMPEPLLSRELVAASRQARRLELDADPLFELERALGFVPTVVGPSRFVGEPCVQPVLEVVFFDGEQRLHGGRASVQRPPQMHVYDYGDDRLQRTEETAGGSSHPMGSGA